MKVKMRWMVEQIVEVPDGEDWDNLENRYLEDRWTNTTSTIENVLFDLPGNISVVKYDLEEL